MARRKRLTFDEIVERITQVQKAKEEFGQEGAVKMWVSLGLPDLDTLIDDLAYSDRELDRDQ